MTLSWESPRTLKSISHPHLSAFLTLKSFWTVFILEEFLILKNLYLWRTPTFEEFLPSSIFHLQSSFQFFFSNFISHHLLSFTFNLSSSIFLLQFHLSTSPIFILQPFFFNLSSSIPSLIISNLPSSIFLLQFHLLSSPIFHLQPFFSYLSSPGFHLPHLKIHQNHPSSRMFYHPTHQC